MMRRLSRDPDTLRIPAFMRKRGLTSPKRQALISTALDRKNAGVEIATEKAKSKPRPKQKPRPKKITPHFRKPMRSAKKIAPRTKKTLSPRVFAEPILGVMTHYYDKIQVGVIMLSATLEVGDCIKYKTDNGPYQQIVESMEIDRKPVFKALKGSDIGLKLRKAPHVGSEVQKV